MCQQDSCSASAPFAVVLLSLSTEGGEEVGIVRVAPCVGFGTGVRDGSYPLHDSVGVHWTGRSGGSRLNRKTQAHLVGQGFLGSLSRPLVWKRLWVCDQHMEARVDAERRCLHRQAEGLLSAHDMVGVG